MTTEQTRSARWRLALGALAALTTLTAVALADDGRNFAGSVQLDYMAMPTGSARHTSNHSLYQTVRSRARKLIRQL